MARNEPMIVSASTAICGPIDPMVAGPSALKKARTSELNCGQVSRGSTPCRPASIASSSTSSTPAISTPQAAACPAVGKNAASASATMIEKFNRIGAAAALA